MLNSICFHRFFAKVLLVSLFLSMSACGLFQSGPMYPKKDSAPSIGVNPDTIIDATPRKDAITRAGNKNPYTVLGKTYHLLPTSKDYRAEGIASWYGTKFQGRPTANGEPYNLYAMTAAHRTLPIPAYVKVTNLDNNRTAVVRVNDRGPFHSQRLIDLSYAAAVKLGYAKKGTARVSVEVVDLDDQLVNFQTSSEPDHYFLQVAAFKNLASATALRNELLLAVSRDVFIKSVDLAGIYRVQIGPVKELELVNEMSERLIALGKGRPQLISN
ncbi:MAG: rare lipoprotein A [Gammaproteobacteria bacterium]|jgi:rare lipoprotein A